MKFIKILAHDLKLIFEWFIISMPDTIIFNYLRKKIFLNSPSILAVLTKYHQEQNLYVQKK